MENNLLERFMNNELQQKNQTEFRIENVINKDVNYIFSWVVVINNLIVGLIKKDIVM